MEKVYSLLNLVKNKYKQKSTRTGTIIVISVLVLVFTEWGPEDIMKGYERILALMSVITISLSGLYDAFRDEKVDE